MYYKAVINPAAGAGRGLRVWRRLEAAFGLAQIDCRPHYSRSPEHSRLLAQSAAAEGYDAVVAVGGDGTINDAAAGTIGTGLPLAVVPAGTGNAYAHSLGQSAATDAVCRSLLNGQVRRLDVGQAGERIFVNMAGIGFDADVLQAFKRRRIVRGIPGYLLAGLQTMPEYRPPQVTLSTPAGTVSAQATVVAICNGPYYGGKLFMAPQADMTDGLLDICILDNLTRAEYFAIWYQLFSGRHVRHPKVKMLRAATITLESDRPVRYHCDGDLTGVTPCVIRVRPQALKVIV